MNLQNDELAERMLEAAKKFDETAYTKPWNGKRQRLIAKLHYGNVKDPGKAHRTEITNAKDRIYWWIGVQSSMYIKFGTIIDKYDDKEWREKWKVETRIIFNSEEAFFEFVDECFGKSLDKSDINTPLPPKGVSADGFVIICPKCDIKFKRAARCPDCGQLIQYQED